MRRFAICGAVAAILLVPAEALSASQLYTGSADTDASTLITIKVKKEDRKRYVTAVKVENLHLECSEGAARLSEAGFTGARFKVKQGEFRARASDDLRTLAASGEIVRRRIEGTLRYFGSTRVDDDVQDCESGKVPYTARR